ncbi:unnamed protein product [Peronospora destructor]|uniref:Protein kinase domain-containing protein n=2 Tax=Peronospora destructor TaxID=86335 RepID=A0AAV0UKA8_9STRA|nr:unnamed protein product [Peronospora destructor]CAI5737416.1 unnamed protein product [Peronospora destructor]
METRLRQIVLKEQQKMVQLGFVETCIPSSDCPTRCSIFLSANWHICRRLLLVIVSGNGIQPEVHVRHVWETYGVRASCSQVYIAAYGRGGSLTKYLVCTQPLLRSKLAAIAFIESSHRIEVDDTQEVRELLETRAINWQRSKESTGTQLQDCAQLGCLSLSAGEPTSPAEQKSSNTAWTIATSMDTVFAFFDSARGSMPDELAEDELMDEMSAYGKVFLAKKKQGKNAGRVYAMKVLRKQDVFKKKQVEHTKSEQRILKHVEHPFVVRLRYAFQNHQKLYLVMDYYSGGSLFVHLRKEKRFSEQRACFYAAELVLSLAHLHSMHIMYRDLKLENILVDSEGHIAITDFGLSKEDDEGSTFQDVADSPGVSVLSSSTGSGIMAMHFDDFSYMGSDIIGSRRTSVFRDSDIKMELGE